MRISSVGTVLVGKTSEGTDTDGIELNRNDVIVATRNNDAPLILNRRTSDGDITIFRKDNAVVGSIGNSTTNLLINSTSGSGLFFGSGTLAPMLSGSLTDNSLDIGTSSYRYKDLHLSGTANVDTKIVLDNLSTDYYGTSFQINNTNADFSGALLDMRATSGNVNSVNGRFLRCYSNNGSSEKFHVKGSGEIYTASGILLGGTGSANKLDDYEEGTFNFTMAGYYSNPSTTQLIPANYVKIGNTVNFIAYKSGVNNTGAGGNMYFTGLPFATIGRYPVGGIQLDYLGTYPSNSAPFTHISGTIVYAMRHVSNGSSAAVFHNVYTNGSVYLSGTYQTNA
jgi:hypothetical protein